ncbi:hypothetical protein IV102_28450 [bacterium]|nr:hypothetical protein [bacterium]
MNRLCVMLCLFGALSFSVAAQPLDFARALVELYEQSIQGFPRATLDSEIESGSCLRIQEDWDLPLSMGTPAVYSLVDRERSYLALALAAKVSLGCREWTPSLSDDPGPMADQLKESARQTSKLWRWSISRALGMTDATKSNAKASWRIGSNNWVEYTPQGKWQRPASTFWFISDSPQSPTLTENTYGICLVDRREPLQEVPSLHHLAGCVVIGRLKDW